jgi:hypothetical protein
LAHQKATLFWTNPKKLDYFTKAPFKHCYSRLAHERVSLSYFRLPHKNRTIIS